MYGKWVWPRNDYARTKLKQQANKEFDLTNGLKCELHAQYILKFKITKK